MLVSASAVGFYGDRGDEVLDEESPPGTGVPGRGLPDWEAATGPASAAGIRVVTLRSGRRAGRPVGRWPASSPCSSSASAGGWGSGRQYLSWISLADEVAVIRRALDDASWPVRSTRTAPEPVTNAEFTRTLGRVLGRPAVLWVPRPVLEVAFGTGLTRELLVAGQRVVPRALLTSGHRFEHPELEGALAALLTAEP